MLMSCAANGEAAAEMQPRKRPKILVTHNVALSLSFGGMRMRSAAVARYATGQQESLRLVVNLA